MSEDLNDSHSQSTSHLFKRNIALTLKSRVQSAEDAEEGELEDEEILALSPLPLENFSKSQSQAIRWDFKMNLLGEKIPDPNIHLCELCDLPILQYGRLLECKHIFCFDCAKKHEKMCPRCNTVVVKIERLNLGQVFICSYGSSKRGQDGCRRTYLSQRDLNAHIQHRHSKGIIDQESIMSMQYDQSNERLKALTSHSFLPGNDSRYQVPTPPGPDVVNKKSVGRANLITINLQE